MVGWRRGGKLVIVLAIGLGARIMNTLWYFTPRNFSISDTSHMRLDRVCPTSAARYANAMG